MNITGWSIVAVLAIIAITIFYKKNTVWGCLFAGVVVGIVVGIIYLVRGEKFAWDMILKGAIVGALVGAIVEWLTALLKHRRS